VVGEEEEDCEDCDEEEVEAKGEAIGKRFRGALGLSSAVLHLGAGHHAAKFAAAACIFHIIIHWTAPQRPLLSHRRTITRKHSHILNLLFNFLSRYS
jgi:hypothetical protein